MIHSFEFSFPLAGPALADQRLSVTTLELVIESQFGMSRSLWVDTRQTLVKLIIYMSVRHGRREKIKRKRTVIRLNMQNSRRGESLSSRFNPGDDKQISQEASQPHPEVFD